MLLLFFGGGSGGGSTTEGTPIGLLLSLTQEVTTGSGSGDGTPIGLLLALTVTGTPIVVPQGGHWDSSDPLFYDWWRKRAQEERQKLEVVSVVAEAVSDPPLREETIAAIEVASSIDEIRSLDLLTHELNALQAAIDEYQKFLDEDEEEAAILLLMH